MTIFFAHTTHMHTRACTHTHTHILEHLCKKPYCSNVVVFLNADITKSCLFSPKFTYVILPE